MMKYRSNVNSVGDSDTGSPAFQTSWVSSSSSMSANERRALRGSSTPQDHPQPGHHLFQAERLGDVVVAAERQAGDLVLKGVACGQEQGGRVDAVGAQAAQHAESVHSRHHDVEDDGIGAYLPGLVQCGGTARRGVHLEALELEAHGEQFHDVGFIIDDEDARFWYGFGDRSSHGHATSVHPFTGITPAGAL
jgi:hypothetical protein